MRYFSVAGEHEGGYLNPEWYLTRGIVERLEGPSDGVVSVASATYGESVTIWKGDHLSLVNWFNPLGHNRGLFRDPARATARSFAAWPTRASNAPGTLDQRAGSVSDGSLPSLTLPAREDPLHGAQLLVSCLAAVQLALLTALIDPAAAQGGKGKPAGLSVTGKADANLAPFDNMMIAFLKKYQVPGAALAVTKDGRLVYAARPGGRREQGAGAAQLDDADRRVSKPITALAILLLVEKGKLKLDARVFDILKTKPFLPPGAKVDPRLKNITVRQRLHVSPNGEAKTELKAALSTALSRLADSYYEQGDYAERKIFSSASYCSARTN